MYGNFGIIPVMMGHVREFRYYAGSNGVVYGNFGIMPVLMGSCTGISVLCRF